MSEPRPPTPIEAWLTVPLAFSVSPGSIFTIVPAGIPSGQAQLGPAGEVLAEVEDPDAGLRVRQPHRRERLLDLHGLGVAGRELGGEVGRRSDPGAAPADLRAVAAGRRRREVRAGLGPAGLLAAGVVVRAAEPVVGDHRAERGAPVAVRDHRLGRAVGVGDLQPADQPRRDHRARARVERGQRVARAGDRGARGVRGVERRRERDAGAGRARRRRPRRRPARAGSSNVTPVPGRSRSRTDAPWACTIVSGALTVMPVPLAPAVPTAVIVRVSRLSPVSTVIRSPTWKPARSRP